MKRVIKIITTLIILGTIILAIEPHTTYAAKIWSKDYELDTDSYNYSTQIDMPTNVETATEKILGAIMIIGASVSVIAIALIGFNYIIGSADEKSVDKEKLMTLAFGAFLLAGGSFIIRMIVSAVQGW